MTGRLFLGRTGSNSCKRTKKDGSSAPPQLPPISLLKARDEVGLQVIPDNRMVLRDRETEHRSVMNATEQRHDLPQGS